MKNRLPGFGQEHKMMDEILDIAAEVLELVGDVLEVINKKSEEKQEEE